MTKSKFVSVFWSEHSVVLAQQLAVLVEIVIGRLFENRSHIMEEFEEAKEEQMKLIQEVRDLERENTELEIMLREFSSSNENMQHYLDVIDRR